MYDIYTRARQNQEGAMSHYQSLKDSGLSFITIFARRVGFPLKQYLRNLVLLFFFEIVSSRRTKGQVPGCSNGRETVLSRYMYTWATHSFWQTG